MIIRRMQLKNNLYRDEKEEKDTDRSKPLGEYCVFGYFDAMNIEKANEIEPNAWDALSGGIITGMEGNCSIRSLLCVSGDVEKDAKFWSEDLDRLSYPLLFVSIIRLGEPINNADVTAKMQVLNERETNMAYYSYEHSELIVFLRTNCYSEGHNFCHTLHQIFQIYKMYTIFAVKEKILAAYDTIKTEIIEEKVDCRLRAIVKDWEAIDAVKRELECALKEETGCVPKILEYHMMGNADVLFEINNVSICRLLACYKMGCLLTHSNLKYQEAFYNVETEILERRKNG